MTDYSNEPRVTHYICQCGAAVWCRVGGGWCAGHVIQITRRRGQYRPIVKFETGAKELREFHELRFRKGDAR